MKARYAYLLMAMLATLLVSWSCLAEDRASEESEFSASYMNEFDQYRKQVNNEFETYRNIVNEEFSRYKKQITRHWADGEMAGTTRWVEYSPDFKTRKIVDFEKGTIEIQMIRKKKDNHHDKDLTRNLKDLITETNQTAFNRDTFSQRVEERLVAAVSDVKRSDSMAEAPIVTEMVTGTADPTEKQVDQAVAQLKKEGVVKEKPAKTKDEKIVSITITLPDEALQKKALQFVDYVKKYSDERQLDPSLVFAIMHTESSFNPLAKSYVPAYGLMQIVPRSAGKDAAKYVFGKPMILAPSFLYDCENNIKMGTAYLKVLTSRYLQAVQNDESRSYCAIAAYNTGTGNVARAFTGKVGMSDAAGVINTMKPQEVYDTLLKKLPQEETRNYLIRVTDRMKHYEF